MIIYNPHDKVLDASRLKQAEAILSSIPAKHCFITGSFLHKERYNDIDVFVISRSKKEIAVKDKKVKVTVVDFNSMHSLFFHSISKSCVSKSILPRKDLKVTLADYWGVVNEAVPSLLNRKKGFEKVVRFLVLYTEYLRSGEILDTFELDKKVSSFKGYGDVLDYVRKEVPGIVRKMSTGSYARRFFYTQAGYYKGSRDYDAQAFLLGLACEVARSG